MCNIYRVVASFTVRKQGRTATVVHPSPIACVCPRGMVTKQEHGHRKTKGIA